MEGRTFSAKIGKAGQLFTPGASGPGWQLSNQVELKIWTALTRVNPRISKYYLITTPNALVSTCCNKIPQLSALKQHKLTYSSGRQKSEMGITLLKPRWLQGYPPFLDSRKNLFPCLFSFQSFIPYFPQLVALSSSFKVSSAASSSLYLHIAFCLPLAPPPSLSYKILLFTLGLPR